MFVNYGESERAWRTDKPPNIEDFLVDASADERLALLHELIPLDVDYRRRRGETPRGEDYVARFPELSPAWLADASLSMQAGADAGATLDGEAATLVQPDLCGRCVGDYELLAEIARGGMGVVYMASAVVAMP